MINDWIGRYNWLKRTEKQTKLAIRPNVAFTFRRIHFGLFWQRGTLNNLYILLAMTWHSHMRHYETTAYFKCQDASTLLPKLDTITMKNWPASRCERIKNGYEWKWNENDETSKMAATTNGKVREMTTINKKKREMLCVAKVYDTKLASTMRLDIQLGHRRIQFQLVHNPLHPTSSMLNIAVIKPK